MIEGAGINGPHEFLLRSSVFPDHFLEEVKCMQSIFILISMTIS